MTTLQLSGLDFPRQGERYRHKKRGSSYTVIGAAKLQSADAKQDNAVLVVYQGVDGDLWARPLAEFCDGRFEKVF